MMTNQEHLERVTEHIVEGRCALFVGPDIGESAGGLPTSWELADKLAKACGYQGRYRPLPTMAQIFEDTLGRATLIEFLREQIGSRDYRPLPIHMLIVALHFPIIVSGAWDTLLEQALSQQGVHYHEVRTQVDLAYDDVRTQADRADHAPSRVGLLYKLYGSSVPDADPESLVITERDQLNVFDKLKPVIEDLKAEMRRHVLLIVGYALDPDAVFARIYHDIWREQGDHRQPAFAVQALARPDDAAAWESRGITAIIADPVTFMYELARKVAAAKGEELELPTRIDAPRLPQAELTARAEVFEDIMGRMGAADLVEQTDIPLLSEEQRRDIEAMGAAYERLAHSFSPEQTSARVWLRQGNIEYIHQNYQRAEVFYRRALAADPNLAEPHHNLHYVQLAQGDLAGAKQSYLKSLELNPDLTILPERYRIEDILGRGGLGTVYYACDKETDKPVAVKVLQRNQAQTVRVLAGFKREANILKDMSHPNIVRLLDTGEHQGNYFIVMEFLEGRTLREMLQADGQPFSLERSYDIISQVCDGLKYTHGRNIVHRDLKPSNIMLVDDQVKLIDFGLARPMDSGQLSTLGVATGTVEYMAPEQMEGRPSDHRTDVYAVATVFYELLAGRNPAGATLRPASELQPGLNHALDLLIEKAREYKPEDRYPSVAAFQTELKQVVMMQDAAENAPWPLRLVGRGTQVLKVSTERGWPWLLAAAFGLGFLAPPLLGDAIVLRQIARTVSVLLTLILAVPPPANWFTVTVARRARSAPSAAYGQAMGVLLALVNGLLWMRSIGFGNYDISKEPAVACHPDNLQSLGLGRFDNLRYVEPLLTYLALTLVTTLIVFVTMWATGALTQRFGRRHAPGFFTGFLLWILLLPIATALLPYGWFACY
jgi:tetratricopeptide (TPR) repeat protein